MMILDEEKVIGMLVANNFNLRTRSCHFGILVERENQNQGVGVEATKLFLSYLVKNLGFRKIVTVVLDEHLMTTLEKLGFIFEGQLFKECFINGKWMDSFRMAYLVKE
jgi:RimJ/RimL family protein N-acetyltransferase